MSNVTGTLEGISKDPLKKTKDAWVSKYDTDQGKNVDDPSSQAAKLNKTVKDATGKDSLLSAREQHERRLSAYRIEIDSLQSRFFAIHLLSHFEDRSGMREAIAQANRALTTDLSVPKNNDALRKGLDKLTKQIEEAEKAPFKSDEKQVVSPALRALSSDCQKFIKTQEFTQTRNVDPTVQDRLNDVVVLAKGYDGATANIGEALSEYNKLVRYCKLFALNVPSRPEEVSGADDDDVDEKALLVEKRREGYKNALSHLESRYKAAAAFGPSGLASRAATELKAARSCVDTGDLAEREDNDKAASAINALKITLDKALKDIDAAVAKPPEKKDGAKLTDEERKTGLGTRFLKLVDGPDYARAVAIEPDIEGRVGTLASSLRPGGKKKKVVDLDKAEKTLGDLEKECSRLARASEDYEDKLKDPTMVAALREQSRLRREYSEHRKIVSPLLDNPPRKEGKATADRINKLLLRASIAIDDCVQRPELAGIAETLLEAVDRQYALHDNDPKQADKVAGVKARFDRLRDMIDVATRYLDSGVSKEAETADGLEQKFGAVQQALSDADGESLGKQEKSAEELEQTLIRIVKEASGQWKKEQKDAGEVLKTARLLARGGGDQTKGAKPGKSVAEAVEAVKAYDEAKALAFVKSFGAAIVKLREAVKLASALRKQAADAVKLAEEETTKAALVEANAFKLVIGPGSEKFNTNKDAQKLYRSQLIDEKGGLAPSDELKLLQKVQEDASKRWRAMVDKGVDPVKAGEIAFKNIPRNFWPPSAVREMAMFRRAEQTFQEEEEVGQIENEGFLKIESDIYEHPFTKIITREAPESVSGQFDIQLDGIKEALRDQIKEANPDISAKELKEQVDKAMTEGQKQIEEAAKALTEIANCVAVAGSLFKTASSAKELWDKRSGKPEKKEGDRRDEFVPTEDDNVSPVEVKLAEFERKRAILHLVMDIADTILNLGKMGNSTVGVAGGEMIKAIAPGLNIAGNVKEAAQGIYEAGRYFNMLRQASNIRDKARLDPQTMSHLALTREVTEAEWKAADKAILVGTKLMQVVGDAVTIAGAHAAPAGFVVSKVGLVLEYGGKALITVAEWRRAGQYHETLEKARKQPPDYEAVQKVFKQSRKYARYALAWSAVHEDDPWARSWLLTRGIKDSDLDHPETSVTIVREYINVTYEGHFGETQEDDEQTFTEAMPFGEAIAKKLETKEIDPRPISEGFTPTNKGILEANAFAENWKAACKSTLFNDSKFSKSIKVRLESYTKLRDEFDDADGQYKEAREKFLAIKKPRPEDRKEFEGKNATAMEAGSKLIHLLYRLAPDLRSYKPLNKKKTKILGDMQEYLNKLSQAADRAYGVARDRFNEIQDEKFTTGRSEDEARKAYDQLFEDAVKLSKKASAARKKVIDETFDERWKEFSVMLPWGSPALVSELIANPQKAIGKSQTIDDGMAKSIKERCETVNKTLKVEFYSPKFIGLPTSDESEISDAEKKALASAIKKRFNEVRGSLALTLRKQLDPIAENSKEFNFFDSLNLNESNALVPSKWLEVMGEAKKKGWLQKPSGIYPAMRAFESARGNWENAPWEPLLRGLHRATSTRLDNCLKAWQPLLKDSGLAHPTLAQYKALMIKTLAEKVNDFEDKSERKARGDGKDSSFETMKFDGWKPTLASWKLVEDLARRHGSWKGNSPLGTTKAFKAVDSARAAFKNPGDDAQKKKLSDALTHLQSVLGKFGPKHYKTKIKGTECAGLKNFVTAMSDEVKKELANP